MKKIKHLFFAASAAVLLLAGCKKNSADARDKFVGTWKGNVTTVDNYQGQITTQTYTITIVITNSTTNINQIIILPQGSTDNPSAIVSGNTASYSNFNFHDSSGDNVVESLNASVNDNKLTLNGTDSYTSTAALNWIDTTTGTLIRQ